MFDEKLLWKERFSRTSKELSRYLRYIFNGHLVIVFVFLIGTAAYYYQEWLKTVPETFPAAIIMAFCMALLISYSPIFTFMSDADRIFLLPLETKLGGYFRKSILISFSLQIYLIVIGLAIFMPMYAALNNGEFKRFFPFLFVLLGAKLLNMLIRWHVQFYRETNVHTIDSFIRYFVNLVLLYFLFSNASLYLTVVVLIILFGLYAYYRQQSKNKGVKWEFLIEQDERRMTSFYRLANMFTDVPKLKNRVKRRKYLDVLLKVAFQQKNSYTYLYMRTFIRSGDYWGLFIRLTVIGGVMVYFLSNGIGQVINVVVFIFLTGFQLLPLWKHHQHHTMLALYPLSEKVKEQSFLRLLRIVLWVQTVILSMIILIKGSPIDAFIALGLGFLFSYYFVFIYCKRKLKVHELSN